MLFSGLTCCRLINGERALIVCINKQCKHLSCTLETVNAVDHKTHSDPNNVSERTYVGGCFDTTKISRLIGHTLVTNKVVGVLVRRPSCMLLYGFFSILCYDHFVPYVDGPWSKQFHMIPYIPRIIRNCRSACACWGRLEGLLCSSGLEWFKNVEIGSLFCYLFSLKDQDSHSVRLVRFLTVLYAWLSADSRSCRECLPADGVQ